MSELAAPLAIAGSTLGAYGDIQEGKAARFKGRLQKAINEKRAKDVVASSQRKMIDERRTAEILASRALAVAAASGGGAMDPSVVNIISDINSEGAYRASVALYEGEAEARRLLTEGAFAKLEGDLGYSASKTRAASTLLSGVGMAARYA